MKTLAGLSRAVLSALAVTAFAACSASQGLDPNVLPAGPAAASASAINLTATIRIRIPNARRRRAQERPHYISPATKSLSVAIERIGTTITTMLNSNLTPRTPGCKAVAGATICTLKLRLAPGAYTSAFTTYTGPLVGGNPSGSKLSADQSVGFTIRHGKANVLSVTLGGIPVLVTISPGSGSALSGSGTSFTLPKCETSPQPVQVVGIDAGGYTIVGPGAPALPTLISDDTAHLAVATPAPSASPNAFTLVPPAILTGVSVPSGNATVHLTAGITPSSLTGSAVPVSTRVSITYSSEICGIFSEYRNGLTAASEPFGITRGPDGAMWFTEASGNNVGQITTDGTITEFPMSTKMGGNYGIATGADGNLWFTEGNADQIGKIAPSGSHHVTEIPVLTTSAKPWFIAAGSDGNLWFTENGANQIGKIPTSAKVSTDMKEFFIPTSSSGAYGITAGPDNAMWFVESAPAANNVARIPTNAQTGSDISEWLIPTASAGPQYITTGPDNAIWFGECTANPNKIGRITTAASPITQYSLSSGTDFIAGIVSGPDGALWFAESGTKTIGRITTDGASIREFTAPSYFLGGFTQIATGSDGSLWFTELNNGIGRLR